MRGAPLLLGILAAIAMVAGIMAAIAFVLWSGVALLSDASSENRGLNPFAGAVLQPLEVCDAALAGSNTVGERLAPSVVMDYLSSANFVVSSPMLESPGEVRLAGELNGRRCTVQVRSHGSSQAFSDLQKGSTLIGMSSRQIKASEIEALRQAGAGDFAAEAVLAEHVVALDGIAIIVHPDNAIPSLSLSDVRRLFLGELRAWEQVGGVGGAMKLHTRDDASGTYQFFQDRVLQTEPNWDAEVARYESSSELVAAVAADPAAIGFVGVAYVTPAVRALPISDGGPPIAPTTADVRAENYPISRRLFLYVRPETMRSNRFVSGLVRYFKSPAAYERVEELRYVSLRPEAPAQSEPLTPACQADTPEAIVYTKATQGARRLASVFRFLVGSNELDALARDDLDRMVEQLQRSLNAGAVVRLIGHSDTEGDAAVNRGLARERAEALRLIFEGRGVYGLQVDSAGEMCPIADNATPAGRQSNRRVEVWISDRT